MRSMNKIQLTTALISFGKFSYMSFSTPYYKNKVFFKLCNWITQLYLFSERMFVNEKSSHSNGQRFRSAYRKKSGSGA